MKNKLDRMWKEAVVDQVNVLARHFLEELSKLTKYLSQNGWCSS
jgi:hypothetical protein